MHKPNSPVSGLCAYIGHVLSNVLLNVYFELEKENGEQGFEIFPLKTGLDHMWSWWFLLLLLLPFILSLSLFFEEYHATYSFPLILTFVFCLEMIEQAHKKDLKGRRAFVPDRSHLCTSQRSPIPYPVPGDFRTPFIQSGVSGAWHMSWCISHRGDFFLGRCSSDGWRGLQGESNIYIKPERMKKLGRDEERTLLKIKDNVENYSFSVGWHRYRIWRGTSYITLVVKVCGREAVKGFEWLLRSFQFIDKAG